MRAVRPPLHRVRRSLRWRAFRLASASRQQRRLFLSCCSLPAQHLLLAHLSNRGRRLLRKLWLLRFLLLTVSFAVLLSHFQFLDRGNGPHQRDTRLDMTRASTRRLGQFRSDVELPELQCGRRNDCVHHRTACIVRTLAEPWLGRARTPRRPRAIGVRADRQCKKFQRRASSQACPRYRVPMRESQTINISPHALEFFVATTIYRKCYDNNHRARPSRKTHVFPRNGRSMICQRQHHLPLRVSHTIEIAVFFCVSIACAWGELEL